MADHARLSASGSKRWLACPGSLVLGDLFEDEGSAYAEEGTQAHAVAEAILRDKLARIDAPIDMQRYAEEYSVYCMDIFDALRIKYGDAVAFVEDRVSYDEYAPEGFGTADFLALGGPELHLVDFKYGKGVPVYAEGNPQPRLYALGALQEYGWIYPTKQITSHIYQPRLQSISVETLSVAELLQWADEVVKPGAAAAHAGTREYTPGDHCRFCKARATCKARADTVLTTIQKIIGGDNKND